MYFTKTRGGWGWSGMNGKLYHYCTAETKGVSWANVSASDAGFDLDDAVVERREVGVAPRRERESVRLEERVLIDEVREAADGRRAVGIKVETQGRVA